MNVLLIGVFLGEAMKQGILSKSDKGIRFILLLTFLQFRRKTFRHINELMWMQLELGAHIMPIIRVIITKNKFKKY